MHITFESKCAMGYGLQPGAIHAHLKVGYPTNIQWIVDKIRFIVLRHAKDIITCGSNIWVKILTD